MADSIKVVQRPGPKYQVINGFAFPPMFPNVADAITYQARPDDIFIVTYAKNGTTWTQQIVTSILHNGNLPSGKKLYDLCPFLEMLGKEFCEKLPRPAAIKTHMPYELQPKHPTAKYIIVIRNPKDTVVSYYHHHKLLPGYGIEDYDFHQFFPFFLSGDIETHSYFDWYLSWWAHKDNPNVLFTVYEDMKQDIRSSVLKIAKFMDEKYVGQLLANDEEGLKKVIDQSSFGKMKAQINQEMASTVGGIVGVSYDVDKFNFVRKGEVGDWRNHLTDEENRLLEEKFHEKFDGTGLEHLWDNYDIFER